MRDLEELLKRLELIGRRQQKDWEKDPENHKQQRFGGTEWRWILHYLSQYLGATNES